MADHVIETFLADEIAGRLHGCGQRAEVFGDAGDDFQAAALKAAGQGTDGPRQAEAVQGRWAQVVHQTADVVGGRLRVLDGLRQQAIRRLGVLSVEAAGGGEGERLAGELGAEAVVQVAADAAAFFLAGRHQLLTSAAQVGGQAGGVGCGPGLAGDGLQQTPVFGRERFARGALCNQHFPHRFSLIDEGDALDGVHRQTVGDGDGARITEFNRRVGQFERLGDRLHNPAQGCFWRAGLLQVLAQAREQRRRVIPLAVHQVVDRALQTLPQRLEEHRCQAGRQQREQGVIFRAEEQPQPAHGEGVQRSHADRQRAVDQGTVDQQVNVVKPMAQDGNGDGDRQGGNDQVQQHVGEHTVEPSQRAGERQQRGGKGKPLDLLAHFLTGMAVAQDHREGGQSHQHLAGE